MNRSFNILKKLLQHKTSITVRQLAAEYNVSEKTVRNDLLSLDSLLKRYHMIMIRRPGVGISIKGNTNERHNLLEYLQIQQLPLMYTSNERISKLLARFLSSDSPILIKELSLDYYVSRTTISNDVTVINQKLKDYNLKIVYKKSEGLLIEGDEANKRKVLFTILPNDIERHFNENPTNTQGITSTQMLLKLNEILQVDLAGLENILNAAEILLGYTFSTEAFINLIVHLGIAIKRTQEGHTIEMGIELQKKLKVHAEYAIAEQTAQRIETIYQIKFQEAEIYYILLHFLGAKTIKNIMDLEFKISLEQKELEETITTFIRCVQSKLQIFLENDVHLFNSLLLHLRPTINRMIYGLSLHNPLKNQIISNYPTIYQTIQNSIFILTDAYHILFPDDEITYLVLHFAAAMERLVYKTRVLVACASGIGMSQLLVARIERSFKNIEIIATVSILELDKYYDRQIDLIISTVNIEEVPGIKTIVVSPLLSEFDITNIRTKLSSKNRNKIHKQLFCEKHIFDISERIEKSEILQLINEQLVIERKVSKNYLHSLEKREILGSTYIGFGIAVVHGDMNLVQSSSLKILRLLYPVTWDKDNQVDFILSFTSTQDDSELYSTLFKQIGIRLDDELFWNQVKTTKEKQELCILLNKELLYGY